MILDSSFLIDLLRDTRGRAAKKAEELDKRFVAKGVSSVTVLELWRGALRSNDVSSELKKIEELFQSLQIYPLGVEEAKKAAEIESNLLRHGELIDWEDILIAGTAKAHNLPVLTKNVKHFSKIPDLSIETY